VIRVPAAGQYELSLYAAYPIYFWVFVIGAMVTGSLVIMGGANIPDDRSWIFGLLLMLLTNALLVLMPYIRGYHMYGRADAMTHIGFIKDILGTGGVETVQIYPLTHILVIAVSGATGVEPMSIGLLIPMVFSAIYFGAMFYILVYVFDSRRQVLFGLPFVMLPVLRNAHVGLRPFDLSVMFLPLVLYLFVKSQRYVSWSARTLLVVTLIALLLYHPLTGLFVIGISLIYLTARHMPRLKTEAGTPTQLFSISAAIFVAWYSNFAGIIVRFEGIYDTLFGAQRGSAPVDSYTKTVEESSPALVDLIRVATFRYGLELALFGLGIISVLIAVLLITRRGRDQNVYMAVFAGMLGVFGLGGFSFLVLDLIVPPDRPFQIAKIGAVVLIGQLFYALPYVFGHARSGDFGWSRYRSSVRAGARTSLTVVLVLITVLSVFSMYPSPLGSFGNHQVTEMEVQGTGWLTEHGESREFGLAEFEIKYSRFYEAQYGTVEEKPYVGTTPPPHFNYTRYERLGQSYTDPTYLSVTRFGRVLYPGAFPDYRERWRFTPTDFERLERDRSVSQVYTNGDYDQYLIRPNTDNSTSV
jgi:hypothetical protein